VSKFKPAGGRLGPQSFTRRTVPVPVENVPLGHLTALQFAWLADRMKQGDAVSVWDAGTAVLVDVAAVGPTGVIVTRADIEGTLGQPPRTYVGAFRPSFLVPYRFVMFPDALGGCRALRELH
jgi:hypothetical protein